MNIERIGTMMSPSAVKRLKALDLFSLEALLKTSPSYLGTLRHFGTTNVVVTICAVANDMGFVASFNELEKWHRSELPIEDIIKIEFSKSKADSVKCIALNDQRCDACRFWKLMNDSPILPKISDHADFATGECRRHAPHPERSTDNEEGSGTYTHDISWPLTFSDEFCGEFERLSVDRPSVIG